MGDALDVLASRLESSVARAASVADALERFLDTPPPDRPADPDGRHVRPPWPGGSGTCRRGQGDGRGPDAGMTTASLGRRRGRMMARLSVLTQSMRLLLALAIVAGALAATAWGVTNDRLLIVAGGAIGIAVVAVGSRAPLALLLIYVALMPWENAGPPGGAGTVVKLIGLAFGISYVINRGSRLRLDAVGPWVWAFVVWVCASLLWNAGELRRRGLTLVQLFVRPCSSPTWCSIGPRQPDACGPSGVGDVTSFIGITCTRHNSSPPDAGRKHSSGNRHRSSPRPRRGDHADVALAPSTCSMGDRRAIVVTSIVLSRPGAWIATSSPSRSALSRARGRSTSALVAPRRPRSRCCSPRASATCCRRLQDEAGDGRTAIWAVGLNVVEHP
jgi:hypothetical protein